METKQEVNEMSCKIVIDDSGAGSDPLNTNTIKIEIKEEPMLENRYDTFFYSDLKRYPIKTEIEDKLQPDEKKHTDIKGFKKNISNLVETRRKAKPRKPKYIEKYKKKLEIMQLEHESRMARMQLEHELKKKLHNIRMEALRTEMEMMQREADKRRQLMQLEYKINILKSKINKH
ncbi:uncharacterized protein LOC126879261 [Diabrotica virgifera virgifera]|uniref:Uncharacterized protein LOC114349024 n=1 Tax=Diabrotica virgifera virgifera TaxID=50390 RepID=A0A6P7HCA6_DIAVI|nr:uncharacterized protein LOC126879261 [Diabrotica virgifera virgifera]